MFYNKISKLLLIQLKSTESEVHLFTGHENGDFFLWRLTVNTHILEDEQSSYKFLDTYKFAYNNDYYSQYISSKFELKLKFDEANEFHTKKKCPLRLIKLSEDCSVLITIHDDLSLNYWSYADMKKKAKILKVCPQCNSQIGNSKLVCTLCNKKICIQCKIVVKK
jgi:hypothetical protein